MAWLTGWNRRTAVTIDMSTKSGSGTTDATVVIPQAWDLFWSTIDASGDEIRVTKSDGTTAIVYEWAAGFDKTTKTGTLEIDDVSHSHAPSAVLVWLYWDNSGASDGSASVTPSSPVTGYVDLLVPTNVVSIARGRGGSTTPRTTISATTSSVAPVGFDVRPLLRGQWTPGGGKFVGEELSEVAVAVNDTSDQAVASATTASTARFVADRKGHSGIVTMYVDAPSGSLADSTDYVAVATCYTTDVQTVQARASVAVRDVRPSA